MKNLAIVAFALLTLLSAVAFGTSNRTYVMGDNDRIMVDDGNIFRYPGRTFNYPNLALGEFEEGDFYNFGISWQFAEENPWVLATFVSTYTGFGPVDAYGNMLARFPSYDDYDFAPRSQAAQSSQELNNGTGYPTRLSAIYSRQLGGNNFGFGVDVIRASWQFDQDSVGTPVNLFADHSKQTFSQFNFKLGLTEGTSGAWDLAAYFDIGSWTNENDSGQTLTKPSGFYEMGITGRYFYVYNPKITLVPHGEVAIGKHGVESHIGPSGPDNYYTVAVTDSITWTTENTGMMFDVGCGLNYTSGPKMLAVMDFGVDFTTYKWKYSGNGYEHYDFEGYDPDSTNFVGEEKDSYLMLPYLKIGFEGEVFTWLDVRAGAETQLWFNKETWKSDYSYDEKWDFADPATYLGAGFHFGRLHLDTYMDPSFLTNGPYFTSGNHTNPLNWSVSMLYELF